MSELNPNGPAAADWAGTPAEYEDAKHRANFGDADARAFSAPMPGTATPRGAPPVMPIDINQAQAFLTSCETSTPRVTYGLGAKVPFFRARPGVDFTKVDCSGFVREAVREATNPMTPFPDGSVVQHDWVSNAGYRPSTVTAAKAQDGKVRIAFLAPQDTSDHIGHVVLIWNAHTLEFTWWCRP